MKFEIDRSKWSRADRNAKLVRQDDGMMCCLGFFLLACGVPRESLLDVGEPQEPFADDPMLDVPTRAAFLIDTSPVVDDGDNWNDHYSRFSCARRGQDLIEANDSVMLTGPEREQRIAELFAKQGVEVSFVDGAAQSERPAE